MTNEQFEQFLKGDFREALKNFSGDEKDHLVKNILATTRKAPYGLDTEKLLHRMKEKPVAFYNRYKDMMKKEDFEDKDLLNLIT